MIRSPLIIRTVGEAFLFSAIRRDPFHSSARHGSWDVSNCQNLRCDCWEICCSFCNCLQHFWTSFLKHSEYSHNIPAADKKGSQPVSLNQSSVHYRDFQSFTLNVSFLLLWSIDQLDTNLRSHIYYLHLKALRFKKATHQVETRVRWRSRFKAHANWMDPISVWFPITLIINIANSRRQWDLSLWRDCFDGGNIKLIHHRGYVLHVRDRNSQLKCLLADFIWNLRISVNLNATTLGRLEDLKLAKLLSLLSVPESRVPARLLWQQSVVTFDTNKKSSRFLYREMLISCFF